MNDYRKVLIAVNGSKDVLVQGLRLIGSEKCNVTVVKVVPTYDGDINLTGVRNIEHILDGGSDGDVSEIKEVAKSEGFAVKVRIEAGDIGKRILEVAEEESSDLIIMGSGSQSSIKRLFLGSIIDEVTHQATCPVLAINTEKVSVMRKFYDLQTYREIRAQKQQSLAALRPRFY